MSEEEYISYILDDFVIYRTPDIKTISEESLEGNIPFREREAKGQGEFELPSAVYVKAGVKNLGMHNLWWMANVVFDGVLKSGGKEEVLHCVPFDKLSIGNLVTPTEHNLNNSIWIQSLRGAKMVGPNDVWYELGSPAAEYAKHWEAFMWLAYLVKYVSDALQVCIDRQQKVTLNYFQKTFADDMRRLHSDDIQFQKWLTLYGKGITRDSLT